MIAAAYVSGYLLVGLVVVAAVDRQMNFNLHAGSDITAACGVVICWPVVALFGALWMLVVVAIRLARGGAA